MFNPNKETLNIFVSMIGGETDLSKKIMVIMDFSKLLSKM